MLHWYVFQSKPRKERFLCEQLRLRHIETFFPCIRMRPAKPRIPKFQAYFPGYVFGHVDLEAYGRSILEWIPGAIKIVNFGGEPVPVQDYLINTLRQHLESINTIDTKESNNFHHGDVVGIHGGPFDGFEGIFNTRLPGRDRVEVLLRMLE